VPLTSPSTATQRMPWPPLPRISQSTMRTAWQLSSWTRAVLVAERTLGAIEHQARQRDVSGTGRPAMSVGPSLMDDLRRPAHA